MKTHLKSKGTDSWCLMPIGHMPISIHTKGDWRWLDCRVRVLYILVLVLTPAIVCM